MRNTLILALLFMWPAVLVGATLDVAGIDKALGAKGKWNDTEKAHRVEFVRDGQISWATFQTGKEKPAIMLGEFVLRSQEVNPAIDAALPDDDGFEYHEFLHPTGTFGPDQRRNQRPVATAA